jgi:hypothetical protein
LFFSENKPLSPKTKLYSASISLPFIVDNFL